MWGLIFLAFACQGSHWRGAPNRGAAFHVPAAAVSRHVVARGRPMTARLGLPTRTWPDACPSASPRQARGIKAPGLLPHPGRRRRPGGVRWYLISLISLP